MKTIKPSQFFKYFSKYHFFFTQSTAKMTKPAEEISAPTNASFCHSDGGGICYFVRTDSSFRYRCILNDNVEGIFCFEITMMLLSDCASLEQILHCAPCLACYQ